MSNTLLPCPFCGGEAELHCDLDIYAAICSKCGAYCKGYTICPASGMEITDDDYCSYGAKMEAL